MGVQKCACTHRTTAATRNEINEQHCSPGVDPAAAVEFPVEPLTLEVDTLDEHKQRLFDQLTYTRSQPGYKNLMEW